ncbi:MAG: hypothetical protein JST19_20735 [Bacteroidetes bacterium]|nr:hypothetical protein [Bacteroidota bacterium]
MDIAKNMMATLRAGLDNWSQDGLRKLFSRIDQLGVRRGVDKMGLDGFIEHCARVSAATGIISGGGGMLTMSVGIPIDLANLVTQQIRVALGIIYHYRGGYVVSYDEAMSIMTTALQVEAGIAVTKGLLERGAENTLLRIGPKTAARLVPVVGAVIGGTANYLFVKRMARKIKAMDYWYEPVTVPAVIIPVE